MQYRTDRYIVAELRGRINYATTQREIAAELGVSNGYLSEVLAGKKSIGEKILKALGYDPRPHYRRGKS